MGMQNFFFLFFALLTFYFILYVEWLTTLCIMSGSECVEALFTMLTWRTTSGNLIESSFQHLWIIFGESHWISHHVLAYIYIKIIHKNRFLLFIFFFKFFKKKGLYCSAQSLALCEVR